MVEGWSVARVAAAFGVTTRTVRKWQARHAREGLAGLRDRSSRPHVSPTRLDEAAAATTLALRRKHRNVRALCQRCHLLHDRPEHRRRILLTLRRRRALGDLFSGPYSSC